jgi:hypothetical protein
MADTREFSSSMSTPQSGSANLNIVVRGVDHEYNPFGPDMRVVIPSNATEVLINAPTNLDAVPVTQYDEGDDGRAKYIKCMELLGDGQLPICTARNAGPAGTHGAFGPLSFITDYCELCFSFSTFNSLTASMILKLTSAGVWSKVT